LSLKTQKAVIPAAGLGTRLLTATKELPKEMLSVFSDGVEGGISLKPVAQLIFEQLHDWGIREFCFIVGRGKRAIEDHFTPDTEFVRWLEKNGKKLQARALEEFYRRVLDSSISWVNQPQPRGFGDAVLRAQSFAAEEPFIVHAGDNYVTSLSGSYLSRMHRVKASTSAEATLLLRKVSDPRQYGVVEVKRGRSQLTVQRIIEKPTRPPSNLAVLPVYLFEPSVFDALSETRPGKDGEIQLTDAIQGLIDRGVTVNAVELLPNEYWLDVGTPEAYWQALKLSHATHFRR